MPRSIRTKRQRQLEEDYESVLKKRSRINLNDREDPNEFDINADFDYDGEENMQNQVDVIYNENFQDDLRMLAVSNSTSFSLGCFYLGHFKTCIGEAGYLLIPNYKIKIAAAKRRRLE